MSAFDLQERLSTIECGLGKTLPAPDYLRILSADMQEFGLPDMATPEGLNCIDQQIGDAEVVILDNLSTLMRSGKENEAESYAMFQDWALGHRRAGRTIVLVHHAGKNGAQRGTSKREDVLDTIMKLEHPEGYNPNEGALFNVTFTKARNFYGVDAEPFEAKYQVREGAAIWTRRAVQPTAIDKLINIPEGMSLREAEKATGVSKSTLSRRKQKGLLQTVPLSQTVADGTVGQVPLPKKAED